MKFFTCLLLFTTQLSFGQIKKLVPGSSIPGFMSLTRYDATRQAVKGQEDTTRGRLIQVNLWYPSKRGNKNMSFADYVSLVGRELTPSLKDSSALRKGTDTYFTWPASAGADKEKFKKFLQRKTPMLAQRSSMRTKEKRPIILLVHGYASDYAYMAEHLASHGYIVLQVPVKGTTNYELDFAERGLDTQVKDYEFAMGVINKELGITGDQMAVVGFSFGGQSAIALSLRQKNIK
ncbi:MAG: hypothetical protein EOO00_03280, partial [Chitinophagaceae bacterium]